MNHQLTPREIGNKLKQAGRLKSYPLCIYGADTPPVNSIPSVDINRCIANVIYSVASDLTFHSTIHITKDDQKKCCPGGQAWFGYKTFLPYLKYFLSSGSSTFRNGAAEFLISDPDRVEKRLPPRGSITPLGEFIIISRSDQQIETNSEIKAFLCFGNSEQIRNLCSLAYFSFDTSYGVNMPWGPSCASFVSYPTGMIENSKTNGVILGPTDPTGNHWFPENFLSIGIPFQIALQMAVDLDSSFISKRPKIAYPNGR